MVKFPQFFRGRNYNFQGSLHWLQELVVENWVLWDVFTNHVLLVTFSLANPPLLQANQGQTRQAWRWSTHWPPASPGHPGLHFLGQLFFSIMMTLSSRSIDSFKSPLSRTSALASQICCILREAVSEEEELEVSTLLGPDPGFLARTRNLLVLIIQYGATGVTSHFRGCTVRGEAF